MLSRANSVLSGELDLLRFLTRLRRQTLAMLALSDRHQRLKIDKLAGFMIHESSDLSENGYSSTDGQSLGSVLPKMLQGGKSKETSFDKKLSYIERLRDKGQSQQSRV